MLPQVDIIIGKHAFTSRELTEKMMHLIVTRQLEAMGIRAAIRVTSTDSDLFMVINGMPAAFPLWIIQLFNTYIDQLSMNEEEKNNCFWSLLVAEICWQQPGVLLQREMIGDYFPELAEADELTRQNLFDILQQLLDSKLSLAGLPKALAGMGRLFSGADTDWSLLYETCFSKLAADELIIICHPLLFDQLIKGQPSNTLADFRLQLQEETGIEYPPFHFEYDARMPLRCFRFRINSYTSLPYTGVLAADEVFVNATPTELSTICPNAKPLVNPLSGDTASVVGVSNVEKIRERGLVPVYPSDFLVGCLRHFLQLHGYGLITRSFTTNYLKLAESPYPNLTTLYSTPSLVAQLSITLRMLSRASITLRAMALILEAVLETETVLADEATNVVFSDAVITDDPDNPGWLAQQLFRLAFVRMRLKRQLTYHLIQLGDLTALQVETGFDRVLNRFEALQDPDILQQTRNFLSWHVSAAVSSQTVPVIVTNLVTARWVLERVLRPLLPGVLVLYTREITWGINFKAVQRIPFAEPRAKPNAVNE